MRRAAAASPNGAGVAGRVKRWSLQQKSPTSKFLQGRMVMPARVVPPDSERESCCRTADISDLYPRQWMEPFLWPRRSDRWCR